MHTFESCFMLHYKHSPCYFSIGFNSVRSLPSYIYTHMNITCFFLFYSFSVGFCFCFVSPKSSSWDIIKYWENSLYHKGPGNRVTISQPMIILCKRSLSWPPIFLYLTLLKANLGKKWKIAKIKMSETIPLAYCI